MPYHHIENIRNRGDEKIALLLTARNVAGLLCVAAPAYAISATWPLLLRALIVLAAAVLGVAATLDIRGMAFYERVLWRARGLLWERLSGGVLSPADLPGVPQPALNTRAMPLDGPVVPLVSPTGRVRSVAVTGEAAHADL